MSPSHTCRELSVTTSVGSDPSVSPGGLNCSKAWSLQGGSGSSEGKDEDREVERLAVGVGVPTGPWPGGWSPGLVYTGEVVGDFSRSLGSLVANEPALSWAGRPRLTGTVYP